MVKRDSWQNLAKSLKLIGEGGGGGSFIGQTFMNLVGKWVVKGNWC